MRLHKAGKIRYDEYPLDACVAAGFEEAVARHVHRHTSVVLVGEGSDARRCIVDSEDSFFCLSPLLNTADLYFCSGYNRAFFEEGAFSPPYSWQRPHDVDYYVKRAIDLVRDYGTAFKKVRPYIPISPSLQIERKPSYIEQKLRNAHHVFSSYAAARQSWHFAHVDFEARYRDLLALRAAPLLYDVVLLDTLWGWPRHRYALHMRLKEIAATGRTVHSRLRWSVPMVFDGGDSFPLTVADFPIETGKVEDYEPMLAASRLAVFATGFHWGWRSIMTLALMWGLPVHSDRLLLEPWFDMGRFEITWNDGSDWRRLAAELARVSDAERDRIKTHNQAAFDELLAPEKVAAYFIETAVADQWPRSRSSNVECAFQRLGG